MWYYGGIVAGIIIMVIGIIMAVVAVIWHHHSSVYPNWLTGMIVLFSLGLIIAFIGLLIFGIFIILWALKSPISEVPEVPVIIEEPLSVVVAESYYIPARETYPTQSVPPPPPIGFLTVKVYDPVSGVNLTIDQLKKNCNHFSLEDLQDAQMKYPVYEEHCSDILLDKLESRLEQLKR